MKKPAWRLWPGTSRPVCTLAIILLLTGLLACTPAAEAPRWFEGSLAAVDTPVLFTVDGLQAGGSYRLRVYDRYSPSSQGGETASTKTRLTRPDGSTPADYAGTHDGFHYSDDPGGILISALDRSLVLALETSRASGLGSFRLLVEPADAELVAAARRVPGELAGVPLLRRGQAVAATGSKVLSGVFLHGSAVVPSARDLQGSYAGGGNGLFVSHGEGRFVDFAGPASLAGLQLDTAERAGRPEVAALVADSALLYLDGGDQAVYYRAWHNSAFATAVNAGLSARRLSIGGNSAGLAILGQHVYAALHDHDLSAGEALLDPYNQWMTLESGPFRVPGLEHAITESHYAERERQGRLVAFLARLLADGQDSLGDLIGIGVDENTALVIDQYGLAKVFGPGSAWVLVPRSLPERCQAGQPLEWPGEAVVAIELTETLTRASGVIWRDIRRRAPTLSYSVEAGRLRSSADNQTAWASLAERLAADPTARRLPGSADEIITGQLGDGVTDLFVEFEVQAGRRYELWVVDSYNNGRNPGLQLAQPARAVAWWLLAADGVSSYPEEAYLESEADSQSAHGFMGITPDGKPGPVARFAASEARLYVQLQGYRPSYTGQVALRLVALP